MTITELLKIDNQEIVEVNGVDLGFQVSLLSNRKGNPEQEECLLVHYYEFLQMSKKTGFRTQYIEMSALEAKRIFDGTHGHSALSIRKRQAAN